jgi:hypothetical protein
MGFLAHDYAANHHRQGDDMALFMGWHELFQRFQHFGVHSLAIGHEFASPSRLVSKKM